MAYNQTVTLIGNLGDEAQIIEQDGKQFAAFSIATTDSYLDQNEQWQQKSPVWHRVLSFNPYVIEKVKRLMKGTRLEIVGSLSYRPFETMLEDGRVVKKMEATIIAGKADLKPLPKKQTA